MPKTRFNPVFPLGQIKRDLRSALDRIDRLKAEADGGIIPELETAGAALSTVYFQIDELQKSVDDKLSAEIERNTILFKMKPKREFDRVKIGQFSV